MKFLIPFLVVFSSILTAIPSGPGGDIANVKLLPNGRAMEVRATDKSVIEWDSFSIHAGERVEFLLPNVSSAILNRVVGVSASQIDGDLFSNGQVVLINRNGIVFGDRAKIDVGSLIASTLDLQNNLFNSGNSWVFQGNSMNGVINKGTITARSGDLFFLGHTVQNEGSMTGVDVGLFSGRTIGVNLPGDHRISLALSRLERDTIFMPPVPDRTVVLGSIRAIGDQNGGGEVFLLGGQIILNGTASIDASHEFQGGTVFIGGTRDGNDDLINNAARVYLGPNTRIDASAGCYGNGGSVILWSDQAMIFDGFIDCSGGRKGGDGGFIQIHGGTSLKKKGRVDLSAPKGRQGTLN